MQEIKKSLNSQLKEQKEKAAEEKKRLLQEIENAKKRAKEQELSG